MEYALAHPEGLKGLIISNMMADCVAYQRYADDVLAQMVPAVLKRIKELEAAGQYTSEEYETLLVPYYERHVLRRPMAEWPQCVTSSLENANQDLYVYMQGPVNSVLQVCWRPGTGLKTFLRLPSPLWSSVLSMTPWTPRI